MNSQNTRPLQRFFVGGYTQRNPTASPQGISTCTVDPQSGAMRVLHTQSHASNPSYLARFGRQLFAVEENSAAEGAAVATFAIGSAGDLTFTEHTPVPGDAPCHLSLDSSGRLLPVACYSSGTVVLYGREGRSLTQQHAVQHTDTQIPPRDPHAHQAVFGPDGSTLFVTDLGLDEIRSYSVRAGALEPQTVTRLAAGSGPRHLTFHPSGDYAFVVGELDSSLTLLRHRQGMFEPLTTVSLLANPTGQNAAAAVRVAPSGRFVYASNRDLGAQGNDGIAVFHFDEAEKTLTRTAFVSSGGHLPRDFALTPDGKGLIAAHQGSNTLVSFWVDDSDGSLEATGETLALHQPVCVLMD